MKKKKRNAVLFGTGTSGEKMTDETPDFVCRGCGYHTKNCVCSVQKNTPVIEKPSTSAHLMYLA